jgi:hypothetical protein
MDRLGDKRGFLGIHESKLGFVVTFLDARSYDEAKPSVHEFVDQDKTDTVYPPFDALAELIIRARKSAYAAPYHPISPRSVPSPPPLVNSVEERPSPASPADSPKPVRITRDSTLAEEVISANWNYLINTKVIEVFKRYVVLRGDREDRMNAKMHGVEEWMLQCNRMPLCIFQLLEVQA